MEVRAGILSSHHKPLSLGRDWQVPGTATKEGNAVLRLPLPESRSGCQSGRRAPGVRPGCLWGLGLLPRAPTPERLASLRSSGRPVSYAHGPGSAVPGQPLQTKLLHDLPTPWEAGVRADRANPAECRPELSENGPATLPDLTGNQVNFLVT